MTLAPETITHTELVWDTAVALELGGGGDVPAARDAVVRWLHRVDELLSPFREDSDLSRWRAGEADLTDIAPEVAEVLGLAERAARCTGGAFDPTWAGGRPDPTGLTKGWAVDRAAGLARRFGVTEMLIDAGGDVLVAGDRTRRIGIEDPDDPRLLLDVVSGRELCVATSSRRHRGDHVRGAPGVVSASVVGRDLVTADALATAAVAAGSAGAARLLDGRPGVEGFVLFGDRAWWASSGWPGEVHGGTRS